MTAPGVITLTVKCDLDLDEIYGRVHVHTTRNKSMDWVLDEFCREKKVKRVSTFALRSDTGVDYDLNQTIAECGLDAGHLIYCYNKTAVLIVDPPKPKPPSRQRKGSGGCLYGLLALLFLVVALAGIITLIVLHELRNRNMRQYTVVVDAGSTSSKIFLYSWPRTLFYNTGKVKQDYYAKIEPLSNYIDHPANAAAPLTSKIKSDILKPGLLPSSQSSSSPLYMGATAGLRILRASDPGGVTALFKVLRRNLSTSLGLKITDPVKQIRILSGSEEGLDAWITVNYLHSTLGSFLGNIFTGSESETIGSLDLGGASTQIAFEPNPSNSSSNMTGLNQLTLYGKDYSVYSHSFLCYGKQQAQFRLLALLVQEEGFNKTELNNPCYPIGYSKTLAARDFLKIPCSKGRHGVPSYGFLNYVPKHVTSNTTYTFTGLGDFETCQQKTKTFFNKLPCGSGNCSFNAASQPPLHGTFEAFSGFYYVANFFNATATKYRKKANFTEFTAIVRRYCAREWSDLLRSYSGPSSYTANYCFDGIYVQLLLENYGFTEENWHRLTFVDKINSSSVGWSLGFTIMESGRITTESFISLSMPLFVGLLVLFCLVLLAAILLGFLSYKNRKTGRRGRFNDGATEGYGSI